MTDPYSGQDLLADVVIGFVEKQLGVALDAWQVDALNNVFHPSRMRWHDLNDTRCPACQAPRLCPHRTSA